MIINVPDKDIYLLASQYDFNFNLSLFWEFFSDLVCENVDVDDLETCIKHFVEEFYETRN